MCAKRKEAWGNKNVRCLCTCLCTCTSSSTSTSTCICICICIWSASHTNTNTNNKTHTLHSNTNTATPTHQHQKGKEKETEKVKREKRKRKEKMKEKMKEREKERKREKERRERKREKGEKGEKGEKWEKGEREKQITVTAGSFWELSLNYSYRRASAGEALHYSRQRREECQRRAVATRFSRDSWRWAGEHGLCGECSNDRNSHGTERRQSSLVPYQARSGTRKMWVFRGLLGMPCGSVERRGVETSWQGVPRAHQSGHDVRRAKRDCMRRSSDSRQQHRPQERRWLRRARHRLQGVRWPMRVETQRWLKRL